MGVVAAVSRFLDLQRPHCFAVNFTHFLQTGFRHLRTWLANLNKNVGKNETKKFQKSIRKLLQFGKDSAIIRSSKEVRTKNIFKLQKKKKDKERGESTRSANRTDKAIIPIASCECAFGA